MATRAYTITSYYTPPVSDDGAGSSAGEDSEGSELEQEKIWQTGPLYKSRSVDSDVYVSHRAAHPPRFVPAVLSHDDLPLSGQSITKSRPEKPLVTSENEGLGTWYKSLRNTVESEVRDAHDPAPVIFSGPSTSTASIRLPTHITTQPEPKPSKKRKSRAQDWFIHNALATSALTSHQSSAAASSASSSSSLADILSRAPPPLPGSNDSKFTPPLRTKLGPGNRGYALLAQQGWKEGEGLGSWRTRPIAQSFTKSMIEGSGIAEGSEDAVKYAPAVGEESGGAAASGASMKTPQIVDLTASDDDPTSDSVEDFLSSLPPSETQAADIDDVQKGLDPSRTVLLAPLKTYLKSDRLGIGAHRGRLLSSSTSSLRHSQPQEQISSTTPHGSSTLAKRKPLTDTAQAMYDARDRERRRREEEHRALMLRLKGGKRGSKGFAAVEQEEKMRRRDFLAYMNS